MIDVGKSNESSSGSDNSPSDDNLSKAVLNQVLPSSNKIKSVTSQKVKQNIWSIFGFAKTKPFTKVECSEKRSQPHTTRDTKCSSACCEVTHFHKKVSKFPKHYIVQL